jgi:hypothetical protein
MKTTGGRMVQVRRVLAVDSTSELRNLVKGDRVQARNWTVDHVKQLPDGTPLHVMTGARGFSKPTIERTDNG